MHDINYTSKTQMRRAAMEVCEWNSGLPSQRTTQLLFQQHTQIIIMHDINYTSKTQMRRATMEVCEWNSGLPSQRTTQLLNYSLVVCVCRR